jgi:hypothetical protein
LNGAARGTNGSAAAPFLYEDRYLGAQYLCAGEELWTSYVSAIKENTFSAGHSSEIFLE